MELWNKSPHLTWNSCPQPRTWPLFSLIYGEGTWQKPPCRVWPCRPWWTWPEMIKFAWEYAVVHYSKSPCPKNTRKFCQIFFSFKRRRGLLRKFIFLVQVQAAITGFQTFYWSSRTASPQFIQWPVRINQLRQLGSVHKIHIHLEISFPFF